MRAKSLGPQDSSFFPLTHPGTTGAYAQHAGAEVEPAWRLREAQGCAAASAVSSSVARAGESTVQPI